MHRSTRFGTIAGLLIALVLAGLGCSSTSDPQDDNGNGPPVSSAACVECHADQAKLRATAEPDTSEGGEEPSGEG